MIELDINLSGKLTLKQCFKHFPEFNRIAILTRRKIDSRDDHAQTKGQNNLKVATCMSKRETAGQKKLVKNTTLDFLWGKKLFCKPPIYGILTL